MSPGPGFHLADPTNCDREPIHTPGSIQPHGFLFVLEPGTWTIDGVSANAKAMFWREPTALIGAELGAVLGDDLIPSLVRAAAQPEFAKRAIFVRFVELDSDGGKERYTLVAHASGRHVILEGERAAELSPLRGEEELQGFLGHLSAAESPRELHQLAVAEIRRLAGSDRCLLYQFDADWNGTVIAEDRNAVLPSYMNQRFPASDIPRQARELYRRNRVRIIPTNNYRPVPIVQKGGQPGGEPLDLSLSVLRSVSPVHLEYMRNMGTGSSFSVSVIRDGELWGLLSCHSQAPHFVPFQTRAACDLIGQFLALQLAAREQASELSYRVELTGVLTRLLCDMAGKADLAAGIQADDLLRLGNSQGAAVVTDGRISRFGDCPDDDVILRIAAWAFREQRSVVFSDALAPSASIDDPKACGAMVATLGASPAISLIWFRPEQIQVVEWGGEPRKAIEEAGQGKALHPRKSFEVWRETVRGRSLPWEQAVVGAAHDLRRAVSELILRR